MSDLELVVSEELESILNCSRGVRRSHCRRDAKFRSSMETRLGKEVE
jgi:hypothetical protein